MAKKRTFREFRQGIFKPLHSEKCLNKTPVVFRSNLELKLFKILDLNENIIKWSSEMVVIPYKKPGPEEKMARYFVDIYMEIKMGNDIKKFIVEIKPEKQTKPPSHTKKAKQSTILYANLEWAVNQAKWEQAKKWASSRNMEFLIITENNIDFLEGKK